MTAADAQWCPPCLLQTVVVAIPNNESIDFSHTTQLREQNSSLWDIGLQLLTSAKQVFQNGADFSNGTGESMVNFT
jgi:hypothetical protein